MLVSYKYRLTAADASLLVAVSPFVKIPTAKRSIGNGKWEGGMVVPIQYSFSKSVALSLTPEVDWSADMDGHGHHATMVQVANLGWRLFCQVS